jgi:hypothetical protein
MAREKVMKSEPAPDITPQPFPGESPTVSLALAAARMYGLHEEEEKPSRPARSAAKPKKAVKKAVKKAAAPKRAKAQAKAPKRASATQAKATGKAKPATGSKSPSRSKAASRKKR